MEALSNAPHRRFNPLTGEYVLVSPHRTKRPWQGKTESPAEPERPAYDPNCYLCPGNTRASGHTNPQYDSVYVFDNDFMAINADSEPVEYAEGLLHAEIEQGLCRVVCFSPDHSLTLPEMTQEAIVKVVELWQAQYAELGAKPFVNYVQIFENKGPVMGCSNPHPHGQIWAQNALPGEIAKKTDMQTAYFAEKGATLLTDYLAQEADLQTRVLFENDSFVVLVPFWAVWPFETMVAPKRPMQHIGQMSAAEVSDFAEAVKRLTTRYDNLFEISFPYSAGIHQAPTDGQSYDGWHWHMSFYPPLLRSATVKKFMVGYEMFAEPQRDITAEQAAERLRALSETHYKARGAATTA